MTNQTYTILGIIIAAGSLGGLVSAFTSVDEKLSISFCAKRVVVGIASAFVVPLFLNMISSTLLEKAQSDTTPCPYFVFAGFCVIAAISSKAFISTVSDRLLRQVREEVREVKASVEPVLLKETEPDQPAPGVSRVGLLASRPDAERQILKALSSGKYSLRTLDGIAKETGLDVGTVSGHIRALTNSGLVTKRTGEKGQDLWCLTQAGKTALEGA